MISANLAYLELVPSTPIPAGPVRATVSVIYQPSPDTNRLEIQLTDEHDASVMLTFDTPNAKELAVHLVTALIGT